MLRIYFSKRNIALVLLMAFLLQSCVNIGSQISVEGEQVRPVTLPSPASFNRVEVMGPFNIVLFNGTGVRSNMSDSLLERIQFNTEGSTLYIRPNAGFFPFPANALIIYIGISNLQSLQVQVDGQLLTDGILTGNSLRFYILGNVTGRIHTNIQNVFISTRSPGRISLIGTAQTIETEVFSAATLSLIHFRPQEWNFDANRHGSQLLHPR